MAGIKELTKQIKRWTLNVATNCEEKAAKRITDSLVKAGPHWSGQFATNWQVNVGSSPVAATVQAGPRLPNPVPRQEYTIPVPRQNRFRPQGYTIGNRVVYRDIAMDLVPGRTEAANRITAPENWYRTYLQGGALQQDLRLAVTDVFNLPEIRNYRAPSSGAKLVNRP